MPATIKIKNSSTSGAVPTASDLVQGELAVNVADLGLYTENASGTIVKLNAPSIDDKNTGATKHLTISTGGNLGLGVTPSAWATFKAMQIGNGTADTFIAVSGNQGDFGVNAYYNAGWKYQTSSVAASRYEQSSGVHQWFNAPSGTAGNAISFTQAMTLDASGNLLLGTTTGLSNARFDFRDVNRTGNATNGVILTTTSQAADIGGTLGLGGLYDGSNSTMFAAIRGGKENSTSGNYSGYLALSTVANGGSITERARIDSSGNLLVGTTSASAGGQTVRQHISADNYSLGISTTGGGGGSLQAVRFVYGTTACGSINLTSTTTTYSTSSDYRLKNITGSLTGYKERLLALEPKQGSWIVNGSEFRGFLAHEFAESYPSSVNGEKDAVDEQGNPQYQGMQAGSPEVIADLVAYIKELETRLSALEQA